MVIHPEIFVTPDNPTIRFRQDESQVDLDLELPKILFAQGWGCGTYFNIQFVTHDRAKLLKTGTWVVTEEVEENVTTDNPYNPNTRTIANRKAKQIGDWVRFNNVESVEAKRATVKWNPGKQKHQVLVDGEVVFESDNKEEALGIANAG